MDRTSKALRLVTVEVDTLVQTIGDAAAASAQSYVQALALRGYVPVPIPWEAGPIRRGGETDLLMLGRGETPVDPPGDALLRAVAFMENAFHVGRAIGEPGEFQKERIVDIADGLESLAPDERSVLGAHYVFLLRVSDAPPRPMNLMRMTRSARDRTVRALYAAATADGTLYDVIVERLEATLDREGVKGQATIASLMPARQVVLKFARTEHEPARWKGLPEDEARLLSWIVARPKAIAADLETKAREIGVDPRDALLRIKAWIDADPTLGKEKMDALPDTAKDQRP